MMTVFRTLVERIAGEKLSHKHDPIVRSVVRELYDSVIGGLKPAIWKPNQMWEQEMVGSVLAPITKLAAAFEMDRDDVRYQLPRTLRIAFGFKNNGGAAYQNLGNRKVVLAFFDRSLAVLDGDKSLPVSTQKLVIDGNRISFDHELIHLIDDFGMAYMSSDYGSTFKSYTNDQDEVNANTHAAILAAFRDSPNSREEFIEVMIREYGGVGGYGWAALTVRNKNSVIKRAGAAWDNR